MPDYEYQGDLDISAIKKKLDTAAKEFNQFATKGEAAFKKIESEAAKAAKATEKVGAAAGKASKAGASFGKQVGDAVGRNFIAGNILQSTLVNLKDFTIESFQAAAAAERLGNATDTLGQRFGTSGDAIVAAIQKSSNYTIGQMAAMQAANQAMLLGVAKSPEEFERLTKIAITLGRAMGQDATKSVEDFTIGVGRQSKLILDNLGLMINIEKAHQKYAASIGKTAEQLTDAEKQQAFLNEALEQGEKKIAGMDTTTLGNAEKVERLNARWGDFQIEFGKAMQSVSGGVGLLDSLNSGLDELIKGAQDWQEVADTAKVLDQGVQKLDKDTESWLDNFKSNRLVGGFAIGADAIGSYIFRNEELKEAMTEAGKEFDAQKEAAGEVTPALEEAEEASEELADAQKKVAEAMADFKTDKARAELDALIKTERAATDAAVDAAQKREDIAKKNLQKIDDIRNKFLDSVSDAGVDTGRDEEDVARDAQRDTAAAATDAGRAEEDAARDTSRSLADISRSQAQKQIDIARAAAQKKADIETAYRRKIQQIAQQFSLAADDAERSRDAVAFLQARRERDLAFAGAGTERSQGLADVDTDTGRAQEEARLENERAREEARIQAEQKAEDRAIEAERAAEDKAIENEQAAEDRAIDNERKLEDLRGQLEKEIEEQKIANEREIEEAKLAEERKLEDLATARQRDEDDLHQSLGRKKADLEKSLADERALIAQSVAAADSGSKQRIAIAEREAAAMKRLQQQSASGAGRGGNPLVGGPIRHFASGGNFGAGETIGVGERGPELVQFPQAGSVIPNNRLPSRVPAPPGASFSRTNIDNSTKADVSLLDPTRFSAAQMKILENRFTQLMAEDRARNRRAGVR